MCFHVFFLFLKSGSENPPRTLLEAQHRCTDLGSHCAGVTCERETVVGNRPGAPEGCTARRGTGGLRPSPAEEVSFLKDLSFSNLDRIF